MTTSHLFQNGLRWRGPDVDRRVLVGGVQKKVVDGCDQPSNAGEGAPADGLVRELGEPPLDQVEPGGAGGDEMQLEARMLGQQVLTLAWVWVP